MHKKPFLGGKTALTGKTFTTEQYEQNSTHSTHAKIAFTAKKTAFTAKNHYTWTARTEQHT